MTDRTEQEGLTGFNLARIVRLKPDSGLTVHPNLVCSTTCPLVIVGLTPRGSSISRAISRIVVIPLPRHTASNVCPRIVILRIFATKVGSQRCIPCTDTIRRHSFDDAVTNFVVVVRARVGLRVVGNTLTHNSTNITDINLCRSRLLRRIGSLRSNDLASNQCTTSGRRNG